MKKEKIILIIIISALSLVGLVIVQINWIIESISLQEEQLKHRTTMASKRIRDMLSKDSVAIHNLSQVVLDNQGEQLSVSIYSHEEEKIAEYIKQQFRYHHIDLAYNFEIVDKTHMNYVSTCATGIASHGLSLDNILRPARAELRINFINKDLYLFSRMRFMLVCSFVLIASLIACFILTIRTIWKQKKLSEMTSDFINNMTHELKTPISTVSLASNMLKRRVVSDNPDKIIHYSTIIHDENKKLQEQVEQVLRIAKLERGEFKLERKLIDVNEVIQSAIATIDLQVRSRNGQISCYLNAVRNEIKADVNHLTNVISNLLDNANKYSPEEPEITVSTQSREDGLIISVEDRGIGMSKDKQKYIFHKFYRVPTGNIHNVKGFGLGLAYVKMMVDAHNGQINLSSEPGKGSRFDIFLPYE